MTATEPVSEGRSVVAVCTNRARPNLQNNHSKGHAWWTREVYHLEEPGQHYSTGKVTLCGRNSTDWLTIGAICFVEDHNCCVRCATLSRSTGAAS